MSKKPTQKERIDVALVDLDLLERAIKEGDPKGELLARVGILRDDLKPPIRPKMKPTDGAPANPEHVQEHK